MGHLQIVLALAAVSFIALLAAKPAESFVSWPYTDAEIKESRKYGDFPPWLKRFSCSNWWIVQMIYSVWDSDMTHANAVSMCQLAGVPMMDFFPTQTFHQSCFSHDMFPVHKLPVGQVATLNFWVGNFSRARHSFGGSTCRSPCKAKTSGPRCRKECVVETVNMWLATHTAPPFGTFTYKALNSSTAWVDANTNSARHVCHGRLNEHLVTANRNPFPGYFRTDGNKK
eukprot:scpid93306/ scgid10545/ 